MDKTLRTTSIPLLTIRPTPSNLHLRGHGDDIIAFRFRGTVENLAISNCNSSDGVVVRARREARRFFQVVTQPTACGAGVRTGAGRAEEPRHDPGNEWLERGSARSDKRQTNFNGGHTEKQRVRGIRWHMTVESVKEDETSNACHHSSLFISIYRIDRERRGGK